MIGPQVSPLILELCDIALIPQRYHTVTMVMGYICNIYYMVGKSIANISNPRCHTLHRGKYAAEVRYRGYGPSYNTVYVISYGECATDEPFCLRWPNIFKTASFFTQRLI